MTDRRQQTLGWIAYGVFFFFIGIIPFIFQLPLPRDTIEIGKAELLSADGEPETIALPHRWRTTKANRGIAVYRVRFDLEEIPDTPLYLFIPGLKRRLEVSLAGEKIFDSLIRLSWSGPLVPATGLLQLPARYLSTGTNTMTLTLHGEPAIPSYLSELYVGAKENLIAPFKVRTFYYERLMAITYGVQFFLSIGMLIAYLSRPRDKVFGWFCLILALSSSFGVSMLSDVAPSIMDYYPLAFLLGIPIGCSAVNFSLCLIGRSPPAAFTLFGFISPGVLLVLTMAGLLEPQQVGAFIASPILIVCLGLAFLIAVWGAVFEKRTDAGLVAGPIAVMCVYLFHDLAVSLGHLPGNTLMSQGQRTLLLFIITAVLLRRLAVSLNQLDRNDEILRARLQEQEAELNSYFHQQQEFMKQAVVETERRRLISDLHDGMGGHLVSILALSDDESASRKDVQSVARRALDDLRLVIFSLDTDSDDLAYALALYKERLLPVLRNLGITPHWSIAELPDIDGGGPGRVLSVLRILQEAVTNAQKHGEPDIISITGKAGPDGTGLLVVENRGGVPYAPGAGAGYGVDNMTARAHSIGGRLEVVPLEDGARVTLTLPLTLTGRTAEDEFH